MSILQLTKLIGLLSSTAQAVLPAQLQFRYLQQIYVESLSRGPSYQHKVTLNSSTKQDLLWWVQNLKLCNGRCLVQPQAQMEIQTDASKTDWGASCEGLTTRGVWSKQERSLHRNVLELLAVKLVLSSFTKNREIRPIHFQIDNTTALKYLAKMRGATSLEMIKLSKEIRDYLLSHGITINTDHLPSKLNITADRESREKVDSSEKKFYPKLFQRLVQLTGNSVVDLFAS